MKYNCENCKYETCNKTNFSKHLKSIKHLNKTKNDKPINNPNEIIKINNNYKCNHCNNLFKSIELIEKHVKLDCKYDIRYNNFYALNENTLSKTLFKDCENAGEIYIVQTDFSLDNVYKIGITKNLSTRLKQYRTSCNYEPKLFCYIPCKDILLADKIMKKNLNEFNIKREIYKGDIVQITKTIINTIKIINNNNEYIFKPDVKINEITECDICNKVFFTRSDYISHHINNHHKKENICDSKYKCYYCFKVYSTSSNLSKHIKKCRNKNTSDLQIKKKIDDLTNKINISEDKIKNLEEENKKLEEKNNFLKFLISNIDDEDDLQLIE